MIAGSRAIFVGRVAQVVLRSQFFHDTAIDFADGFFFGDFEEASARFFRNPLQNLLAIDVWFFGMTLATADRRDHRRPDIRLRRPDPHRHRRPASLRRPMPPPRDFAVIFVARASARKIDGVHNRVGTLGRLDRSFRISLAAAVDAVA